MSFETVAWPETKPGWGNGTCHGEPRPRNGRTEVGVPVREAMRTVAFAEGNGDPSSATTVKERASFTRKPASGFNNLSRDSDLVPEGLLDRGPSIWLE